MACVFSSMNRLGNDPRIKPECNTPSNTSTLSPISTKSYITYCLISYVSVEPLMTIFSLWRATFHAPANSSYTRSCFDTLYIGHLSRTVTATKAGVKCLKCYNREVKDVTTVTGNYSHRHRQNQTSGKSVCEPVPKSLFWAISSAVYQDLSKGHDWPVKKAIADLPIRSKGNQTALQVTR